VHVAKRAKLANEAIIFVHSHPDGFADFSQQDDREKPNLMAFFRSRGVRPPFASMLFHTRGSFQGRIWNDGEWHHIERTRILGRRFSFVDYLPDEEALPEFYDRQVRAFGPDIQRLLRRLHIGVIGAGGTASALIEQLVRLGVGTLSIFDGENIDKGNVTRVYGSCLADDGTPKVEIQRLHAKRIGFGTKVNVYPTHITDQETVKRLRDCDVIFGCTDKHAPRGILVRTALWYFVAVFDMAVKIHSEDEKIRGIWGRVTTLLPGEACLFCRGRIDPETIRAESLPTDQLEREIKEGYIAGLETNEPAVVTFTTAVAAQAVTELLHRLTGFMGEERRSSEVLMCFHESRTRTNRLKPNPDCMCQQKDHWGKRDTRSFLGLVW
jgi:molybdopterin/thiamine biosynthesis adenylyltransferase